MICAANDIKYKGLQVETRNDLLKNKKNKKIKNKLLFMGLIFLIVIMCGFYLTSYADANNVEVVNYHVQQGDTLWSIAAQYNKSNIDVREFIFNIKKINNLDSSFINTGEFLKIPIYSNY